MALQAQNRGWHLVAIPQLAVAEVSRLKCAECTTTFFSSDKTRRGMCCSARCYRKPYDRELAASRRVDWDRSDRTCPRCSRVFGPVHSRQTYCDATCQKAARRARERANGTRRNHHRARVRAAGGYYEPVRPTDIFKRDGWRCFCGRLVRRDKKAPHPYAPTLDHIVPVTYGGDHVAENLRTAHFWCNSKRGAGRDEAVQLALI